MSCLIIQHMFLEIKKTYFVAVILGIVITIILFITFQHWHKNRADQIPTPQIDNFTNKALLETPLNSINSNFNYPIDIKSGKTLIFYLETDCSACKKEIQIITELLSTVESKIKVVAISSESKDKLETFAKENSINFPILIDENGTLRKKLKIQYYPTNYILNNGVIEEAWIGNPRDKESLIKALKL